MAVKLSFIVPVYNVAPYLRKCVDSLLAQDYDDYEIILVDDGSTDGSGAICYELAKMPTPNPSLKGGELSAHNPSQMSRSVRVSNSLPFREGVGVGYHSRPFMEGKGGSFASVWGAHTADSTQYNLLKENAVASRKNPTEAESVLWDMLKSNNLGLHFRRQHIILDYIVDFICLEKGLIIELDGGYHNTPEQAEYDRQRTAHLMQLGYTELRFKNEELLTYPDKVIERIKCVASSLPSLQGRVGERPFIHVIHQANAGLSAARNAGIKAAKGEYVCFVDSDDYWEPNVLGGLMAQVEREKLDVLRFDYQNVRLKAYPRPLPKGKGVNAGKMILGEYEVFEPNKTPRYIDRKDEIVDGEMYLNTRMGYACYAWQFIIRRSLIYKSHMTLDAEHLEPAALDSMKTDSSCLFTPGIHYEDVDWLPRMMLRAKRVNSTQTIVYNYFVRQGSITQVQGNKEKIRKNLEDRMKIIETYSAYIEQYPTCIWLKNMQSNMAVGVLTTVAQEFYNERKEYISRLKAFKVFPLSVADQGKTYKRRAMVLNMFGAGIYSLIMHWR